MSLSLLNSLLILIVIVSVIVLILIEYYQLPVDS
jgi:hypothetical protein